MPKLRPALFKWRHFEPEIIVRGPLVSAVLAFVSGQLASARSGCVPSLATGARLLANFGKEGKPEPVIARINPLPDEPTDVFSPEWDRHLERLLGQADERFPLLHPGNPVIDLDSCKIRVRIFRGYMRQLFDETRRILRALKLIIVTSETDRSDLASAVIKLQILFAFSVISVEGEAGAVQNRLEWN